MKKWLLNAAVVGALGLSITACKKDEDRVVINPSAMPALTISNNSVVLTPATTSQAGTTFTWTPAEFGYQAAVSYTLEFSKPGTFTVAKSFPMGSALSKSFTKGELNQIYNDLDCGLSAAPPATPLQVRVSASVGEKYASSMSPVMTFTATPFQAQQLPADKWAIIGTSTPGGWNTETPLTYDFCTRTWKARLALTAGEFKFRANNDWAKNLGDEGSGDPLTTGRKLVYNVAPTPNPPNLTLTTAGTYTVTLDVNASPNPTFKLQP